MALELTILDPSAGPPTSRPRRAPRPATLDGLVVGAIWNSRPHGDKIIQMVIDRLRERYKLKGVVFRRKPYLGNAAPPEVYDELIGQVDFAITGVGD